MPFESRIPWSDLALFVPIRRVFGDSTFDLIRYLDDIPNAQRERMRAAGRAARHALTFHEGCIEPGDAVDLIVRRRRSGAAHHSQVEQMAMASLASRDMVNTLRRTASYGPWAAPKIDAPTRVDVVEDWLTVHGVLAECVLFGRRCARWVGL